MNNLLDKFNQLTEAEKMTFIQGMFSSAVQAQKSTAQKPESTCQHSIIQNHTKDESDEESKSKKKANNRPHAYQDYPDQLRKEAVELASKYNNNRRAAREIQDKYKNENKYQSISEKSIRDWRNDPKINANYDSDHAKSCDLVSHLPFH